MKFDSNIKSRTEELATRYFLEKTTLPNKSILKLEDNILKEAENFVFRNRNKVDTRSYSEDMKQAQRIGIINAIRSFDPSKGPFLNWAICNARKEVTRDESLNWINIPEYVQTGIRILLRFENECKRDLGRLPTDQEIYTKFKWSPKSLKRVRDAHSLNHDETILDYNGKDNTKNLNLKLDIEKAISYLKTEDQRFVVKEYFFNQSTLEEISDRAGVSTQYIKKVLDNAKEVLKEVLADYG